MTLDPSTHRIYLSATQYGDALAGGGRPRPLPGSFRVLVHGMASQ